MAHLLQSELLLRDQQSGESGELPPLHVCELTPEPVPATGMDQKETKLDTEDEKEPPRSAMITVAQRRSELISPDLLHPLSHRVFGIPMLLRIPGLDKYTGSDLYDLVAQRLRTLVPKSAVRFLMNSERPAPCEASSDTDDNWLITSTDQEDVSGGTVPRYGFRLRNTSRDGRKCLKCPWFECCIGCYIPDNDKPAMVQTDDSIVVDWHMDVDVATNGFGVRLAKRGGVPIVAIQPHSSCGKKRGLQHGAAVTLEECLDAFAKEEKIPEAYCSKCQDLRVQTKRMSLWRLPPIVIMHLKRFQFTQTMRRKLRELVVFPTEGLDLSRIMAPDSCSAAEAATAEKGDDNEMRDDGRSSEMLYDLYGVIHHQGALSGGHYVASLKSELDGQWRLFNDAQIYEIHEQDAVDPTAYILFYIRRDASKAELSDYWRVRESDEMNDAEAEMLLKGRSDRCTIS